MFCPLYTNREVFDQFNEIVEAFGGRALTEEEFRSSELRNQREGLDLQAMNATYAIWDMNGGYPLDKTKNGELSLLFKALLDKNNGDRAAAINEKSNYYTNEYLAEHGDWLADSVQSSDNNIREKSVLILDGRKIGVDEYDQYSSDLLNKLFDRGASEYTAWEILKKLKDIISDTTDRYDNYKYRRLVNFLFDDVINDNPYDTGELEKIPIKFFNVLYSNRTESREEASGQYNTNTAEIYISLNSSPDWIMTSLIHEIIHALTISSLTKSYNKDLKSDLLLLIDRLKKIESIKDYYGLTDPYEFVAEFFANSSFLHELLLLPPIKNTSQFKTLFHEVAFFILYVLKRLGVLEKDNASDDEKLPEFYKASLYYLIAPEMYKLLSDSLILHNHYDATHGFLRGMYDNSTAPILKSESLDQNGEPISEYLRIQAELNATATINKEIGLRNQLNRANPISELGAELLSGLTVSTKNVLLNMLNSGSINPIDTGIANMLLQHDIPVRLLRLEVNVLGTTITDENGGSVIILNRDLIDKVSSGMLSTTLLHEMLHAITLPSILSPQSIADRNLSKNTSKVYTKMKKIAGVLADNHQMFDNKQEFLSIFITDKNERLFIYDVAYAADLEESNTLKGLIKSFINSITNKLFDNSAFKTNVENLQQYKKDVEDYLYNVQPIYKGNLTNKLLIDAVYKNYDVDVMNYDSLIDNSNKLNSLLGRIHRNNLTAPAITNETFENIARYLLTRLDRMKRSSVNQESVAKQTQILEYEADLITKVSYLDKLAGLQAIAQNIEPLMLEYKRYIENVKNGSKTMTPEEYLSIFHDDIGTYKEVVKDILAILENTDLVLEFVRAMYDSKKDKMDITTSEGFTHFTKFEREFINKTIKPLLGVFNDVQSVCVSIENQLLIINQSIVQNSLGEILAAVKDPDAETYLNNLAKTETDAGLFLWLLSPMDGEQDPALRSIAYLIRKANKTADLDAYYTMMPLAVELENLSKLGITLRDFYERDENGRTTGYLIRPFNYGKFYDEYTEEMTRINDLINKKYGLKLLPSNRTSPDLDEARKEWNKLRNNWLKKNSIRKFVDEYYDLMGDLSSETVRQLQSINRLIFQINNIPTIKGEKDKYPNYYNLTEEQWNVLQECLTRKRQLRSDYDEWGNLKTPELLKQSRALLAYYDALKERSKEGLKKDTEAWEELRNEFLESLGAHGFYDKSRHFFDEKGIELFMKDHPDVKKQWDLWNVRNSRLKFKEDENGNALIWKQIESELAAAKPYYGPKEEELTKKINDLLGVFNGTNGHVYDQAMSLEILKKINALYRQRAKLRRKLQKQTPGLALQAAKYGAIIKKYIDFEETERYKQLKHDVLEKANQYEDPTLIEDTFYTLMKQYAHIIYDYDSGMIIGIRPFKWFTKMVAKDKSVWMEYVPGDSFTDFANSQTFKNKEFEEYEKYHVSYIPKGKRFDNSKNFNKVKDTEFYRLTVGVMEKGYGNMKNRQHSDPYLLPQITGGMYKQMSAHQGMRGAVDGAMHWVKDNVGLNGVTQNDVDYGGEPINNYDESNNEETMSDKFARIGTLQNMPDGKVVRIIPQFYVKRKNPEYISNDLLGILSTFYTMTARYKEKSAIKDEIETIIDMLENREFIKYNESGGKYQTKKGSDTRNYKKARKYADMQLYGMKMNRGTVKFNKTMTWEYTKTLQLLKRYTTANNLGANPKVAMVGFLTTTYGHLINTFCGNGYGFSDAKFGALIVSEYILKNTVFGAATLGMSTDVGKMLTDSFLVNLMEMFNLANQFERKYKHSNWNRLQKSIYENSVYGMLASADFLAKSTILVSVLHSFRLVNGEFINKDDIYRQVLTVPVKDREKYITDKLTIYNDEDQAMTLYDAFEVVGKLMQIKPEYKTAVNKVFYRAQSIAEKLAERADGMATEEQKALITLNIIGSLALIHRQYLPLLVAEKFTAPVYDMDMEMYKGGLFYQLYKYIQAIGSLSTKNAAVIGAIIGAYTFNPLFGSIAGALFGGGIGKYFGSNTGLSVKEINKQFFNDYSTEKSSLLSRHNQKIRKLIFLELLVCKAISMFTAFFCKWMDDPENKNNKILQFLALVLRQLEWETFSPYRGDDMLAQIKSFTAASGTSDDIQNAFSLVEGYSGYLATSALSGTGLASSPLGVLYDTISLGNEQDIFREMRSGPYEGHSYAFKIGSKLFPWSNMFEQYEDSKGKRKYLENQIFKLNTTTGTKKSNF